MRLLEPDYSPEPVWVWTPSKLLIAMGTGLCIRLFPHRREQNVSCGDCDMETMWAGSPGLCFLLFEAFCPLCFHFRLWANISMDDGQKWPHGNSLVVTLDCFKITHRIGRGGRLLFLGLSSWSTKENKSEPLSPESLGWNACPRKFWPQISLWWEKRERLCCCWGWG